MSALAQMSLFPPLQCKQESRSRGDQAVLCYYPATRKAKEGKGWQQERCHSQGLEYGSSSPKVLRAVLEEHWENQTLLSTGEIQIEVERQLWSSLDSPQAPPPAASRSPQLQG